MSETSKPIVVYTIPTALLWTCRIGGGFFILLGIVCGAAMVRQDSAVRRATILFAKDHRHRAYPLFFIPLAQLPIIRRHLESQSLL